MNKPFPISKTSDFKTIFFPILAGLVAFVGIGLFCTYLLKTGWGEYALRSKDRSYTLSMLLARQLVAILSEIAAGIVSGLLSKGNIKLVLGTAVIIFCTGSYIHFITPTWDYYPLWYHLSFILLIIPVVVGSSKFTNRDVILPPR